ncbi:hypothetical protein C8Q73DRAFT_533744 [Cubamyces lactineus]|nr:hypothetical protein C8Q73DRAFT_533744 [Cubamyces lactineus]
MPAPREHPVFKDSLADVILRSADNVHFRLHKIVLYLASDFFGDMFSLPQPNRAVTAASPSNPLNPDSETVDELPVIPVTESSTVLESLFRLCYPMDDPPLETIEQVRPTLEAALKYQMREAIKITTARLRTLAAIAPLRVYAIASRLSLTDVATVARNAVRDQGMQDLYVTELEDISVEAYRQLLAYCTATATPNSPDSVLATTLSTAEAIASAPRSPMRHSLGHIVSTTFNPRDAEVVIHTADGIRLGVSKDILRLSSSVFAKKLQSEEGRQASVQQPAILTVPESGEVMVNLLQICYPIPDVPILETGLALVLVFEAAKKYQVGKALEHLRGELSKRVDNPSDNHFSLYLVACRLGMRELAEKAAHRTLRRDLLTELAGGEPGELGLSAGCAWRLLEYHRQCKAAVRSVVDGARTAAGGINGIPWLSTEWRGKLRGCHNARSHNKLPCWLGSYLEAVGKEGWPSGATAVSDAVLEFLSTQARNWCRTCRMLEDLPMMAKFRNFLQEVIDQREQEVKLQWRPSSVLLT